MERQSETITSCSTSTPAPTSSSNTSSLERPGRTAHQHGAAPRRGPRRWRRAGQVGLPSAVARVEEDPGLEEALGEEDEGGREEVRTPAPAAAPALPGGGPGGQERLQGSLRAGEVAPGVDEVGPHGGVELRRW